MVFVFDLTLKKVYHFPTTMFATTISSTWKKSHGEVRILFLFLQLK